MNQWKIILQKDSETGDLILPLSTDLLSSVGWCENTQLLWEGMANETWCLRQSNTGTSEDSSE